MYRWWPSAISRDSGRATSATSGFGSAHPKPVLDPASSAVGGRGAACVSHRSRNAASGSLGPRNAAWMLDRLRPDRPHAAGGGPGSVRASSVRAGRPSRPSPRAPSRRPVPDRASPPVRARTASRRRRRRALRCGTSAPASTATSSSGAPPALYVSPAPPSPAPFGPRTRWTTLYGLASQVVPPRRRRR